MQSFQTEFENLANFNSVEILWSGLRGSNPPPQPWEGRALPDELNPHMVFTGIRQDSQF